jgi:tetratricopeptide (TPR) repeat protein
MSVDLQAQARTAYAYGQDAFERGNYRESVEYFEKAVDLARAATPLGGEIQTWLVNAYNAVGRPTDAIALCEKLTIHPDTEVRKQAKNLLYILKAPQLKRPGNWMTKIPDLGAIADNDSQPLTNVTYTVPPKAPPRQRSEPEPEPIDPSQINRGDNGFLWVALVVIALVLGGVFYLS